jgi:hypothetical protein
MKLEVKMEGTLLILYASGIPIRASTMHTFDERCSLFQWACHQVREWHAKENRMRGVLKQGAVTLDSFARKVCCDSIQIWLTADGSRHYPYAWPDLEEKREAASVALKG